MAPLLSPSLWFRRLLLVLLALGCDAAAPRREADPGQGGPPAPVDADGDGAPVTSDCNDADPTVFPSAHEVCDLLDQDCDGVADDGVPNDGAGCRDPGWPAAPEVVDVIHVTLETPDVANAESDDPVGVCLGDWCKSLNLSDWDDRERGVFDVYVFEGVGKPRSELDGFRVYIGSGTDRWHPVGFAVDFDGEGVYSRIPEDLYMGTEGGIEVKEWEEAFGIHDDSIWPSRITHGPMTGAPFAGGARVWFRTDRSRRVEIRVAPTADGLASALPVAIRYPAASNDFTETVELFGLGDGVEWAYGLVVDGEVVGPFSLRSGPADGSPGVRRIAFGSCTKDDAQPLFEAIREQEPDLFLFVGDNHYGDTGDLGSHRQWYRWAHGREHRAELLREAAVYSTWDDHDYVGNDEDQNASGKSVALRIFGEYWGNGDLGLPEVAGVFSSHTYGDVGIWMLDGRYWRGADDSVTGAEQEEWLVQSVSASDATFKFVVSGSQFNLDSTADSWRSFADAQARVMDALSEVGGVVLLSGDIHTSEFVSVPASAYELPELTSSPLAYNGSGKVVYLDVDTTLADPTVVARIVDLSGAELDRWEIRRSDLGASP